MKYHSMYFNGGKDLTNIQENGVAISSERFRLLSDCLEEYRKSYTASCPSKALLPPTEVRLVKIFPYYDIAPLCRDDCLVFEDQVRFKLRAKISTHK